MLVIGGGFSGLLAAIHLLALPDGPRVRLVERRSVVGRGAAYSTNNPDHLLNVRVANMSAFPDQPRHFIDWLSGRSGWDARGGFVTRGNYGDYLQDLLRGAVNTAPAGRLMLETDEIIDLRGDGSIWRATTAMGRSLPADAVILATGSLPPSVPHGAHAALLSSPAYVADPWDQEALARAGWQVLLLGSGLTMIDVALSLASGSRRRMWAVSRHGLTPREHTEVTPGIPAPDIAGATPLRLIREVRRACRRDDWRAVIDGYRPHVHSLWQSWTATDRKRFLRHLRSWWDVHRHRMAPATARRIEALSADGHLTVDAGRILALTPEGDRIRVTWRPRGGGRSCHRFVDTVVNCMGRGLVGDATDALTAGLIRSGLVGRDPTGLGFHVDRSSRVIGSDGDVRPRLYALGPMTSGAFGEMTSVPDIRVQAKAVAEALTRGLVEAPGLSRRHG